MSCPSAHLGNPNHRRIGVAWALFLALCLAPSLAWGQAPAANRPLAEVERGVWAGTNVGAVVFLDLPGEGGGTAAGSLIGIELGVDLGRSFQLGLLAWGQSVGAPADYQGITDESLDPNRARGDFQSMLYGGSLRWNFLRLKDANDIERTNLYVRAGGGASLSRPIGILDEDGVFAMGGLGVQYHTRLRHFSVGAELGWMGLFGDVGEAHAITVFPHLRYTF